MVYIVVYSIVTHLIARITCCAEELAQLQVIEPDQACTIQHSQPDSSYNAYHPDQGFFTKPHIISEAERIHAFKWSVQQYLDRVAQENGEWEDMGAAQRAAAYYNPFQEQALTLATWWGTVWEAYFTLETQCKVSSEWPTPEELLLKLPPYQP